MVSLHCPLQMSDEELVAVIATTASAVKKQASLEEYERQASRNTYGD